MMKAFCNYAQDLWLLRLDFYSSLKVIRRGRKKVCFIINQSLVGVSLIFNDEEVFVVVDFLSEH